MRTVALMCSGALLAVALAGCDGKQPSATKAGASITGGNPDAPPGIALSDARIQLPVVAGRPGVAYLTVSHSTGPARTIAAVHVTGAGRSEMHATTSSGGVSRMAPVATIPLDAGKAVRFAPGGHHVMLFNLDPTIKPGATSEVTVVFADGDKASIAAPVTGLDGGGAKVR